MKRRRLTAARVCAFGLLLIVFWAATAVFNVPLAFGWLPSLLIVLLLRRSETASVVLASVSVLAAFGALEIAVRLLRASFSQYRPEETLSLTREGHYVPNANQPDIAVPHGDLVAMSGGAAAHVAEPRRLRFKTDALGYRNDRNYDGEKLVLVGDSFVVGVGTTQDEILSVQLSKRLGGSVYNAAFPLEPDGYVAVVRRLNHVIGHDFKVVLHFFEGNDFECDGKRPSDRTWANFVPGDIRRLQSYRLFHGMTHRLQASVLHRADLGGVRLAPIGDRPMAFYRVYEKQVRRSEACDWSYYEGELKSVAARIGMLVFVPEKLRVYQPLMAGEPALPASPALAFVRRLGAELKIPVLDLTPTLQAAAREALTEGRTLFWRDDTHWNGTGIAVAAETLAQALIAEGLR